MKVAITGASGFLGQETARQFQSKGHSVIPIVRRSIGQPNEIICDLQKIDEPSLAEQLSCVDLVIHLACLADFSTRLSIEMFNVNTIATYKLAKICKKITAKYIFASGTFLHGGHAEQISESSKENPDLPYSMSKWLGEQLLVDVLDDSVILRIGGIFGINGPGHLGINTAIENALRKKIVPTLVGKGLAKRNYIYVKDVAKWIIKLYEEKKKGMFYLAGDETLTIQKMLETICTVFLGSPSYEQKNGPDSKDQICHASDGGPAMHTFYDALIDIKTDFSFKNLCF
ncbi:MAG: NAD(P)-dependent oxidoreductase [Pseudomonadota bacterium]